MLSAPETHPFGDLLRAWRQRRRLSQLELASEAAISARHLSFVETGRSQPSRALVLRLAKRLGVPLREQNLLLIAAGYAPTFSEKPLTDPALAAVREAVELILRGHEPYPALVIDRMWNLVTMNRALPPLLKTVAPHLLEAPVNVLRLSLHPQGLAPNIVNFATWRGHLLERLERQVELTADRELETLLDELKSYSAPSTTYVPEGSAAVAVPLRLKTPHGIRSLISTTPGFGTPVDVTLSELALETFFPADADTATRLQSGLFESIQ